MELLVYLLLVSLITGTVALIIIGNLHRKESRLTNFSFLHVSGVLFVTNMFLQQFGKHLLGDANPLLYEVFKHFCKYGSLLFLHFSYLNPLVKTFLSKNKTIVLLTITYVIQLIVCFMDDLHLFDVFATYFFKVYFFMLGLVTLYVFVSKKWRHISCWVRFPLVYPAACILMFSVSIIDIVHVLKYDLLDIISRAIQIVCLAIGGSSIIIKTILEVISWNSQKEGKRVSLKILTNRENDILNLIHNALTYNEIAKELGISVKTVNSHVRNIFDKCGVSSRIELLKVENQ